MHQKRTNTRFHKHRTSTQHDIILNLSHTYAHLSTNSHTYKHSHFPTLARKITCRKFVEVCLAFTVCLRQSLIALRYFSEAKMLRRLNFPNYTRRNVFQPSVSYLPYLMSQCWYHTNQVFELVTHIIIYNIN